MADKPIIFHGTGYRIIRGDPKNLLLEVLGENQEGKEVYQFKGYFGTIEQALSYLVYKSSLLDETVAHDIKSYIQSILETKQTVTKDIKDQLATPSVAVEQGEIDDEEFF